MGGGMGDGTSNSGQYGKALKYWPINFALLP